MGSGTTGLACQNLNRRFIGVELDAGYFEIARQRLTHGSLDNVPINETSDTVTPVSSNPQYRLI
jgi:DNA modification methylase